MEDAEKFCPLLKTPCLKEQCAWFEPMMKCCWAIRNEVWEKRQRAVLEAMQQTMVMPINFRTIAGTDKEKDHD